MNRGGDGAISMPNANIWCHVQQLFQKRLLKADNLWKKTQRNVPRPVLASCNCVSAEVWEKRSSSEFTPSSSEVLAADNEAVRYTSLKKSLIVLERLAVTTHDYACPQVIQSSKSVWKDVSMELCLCAVVKNMQKVPPQEMRPITVILHFTQFKHLAHYTLVESERHSNQASHQLLHISSHTVNRTWSDMHSHGNNKRNWIIISIPLLCLSPRYRAAIPNMCLTHST